MSPFLLFLVHRPFLFVGLYLLIGATDLFDGPIARHFKVTSKLGAKLDGLGDAVLFFCAVLSMLLPPRLEFDLKKSALAICAAFSTKLFVFIFTRLKFKEWNGMHTWLNKSIGAMVYFCLPVFVFMGEVHFGILLAFCILTGVTSLDETIVLLTSKSYNVNHRGILFENFSGRGREKS